MHASASNASVKVFHAHYNQRTEKYVYLNAQVASIALGSARNSSRMRSPDRMVSSCHTEAMVSSCHGTLGNDGHEPLMTQSLDPNMLCSTFGSKGRESALQDVEGII